MITILANRKLEEFFVYSFDQFPPQSILQKPNLQMCIHSHFCKLPSNCLMKSQSGTTLLELVALFVELAIDITTIVVAIGESLQEVDHHSEVYLFFRDGEHFQKVYVFIICPPHDPWYVEVYVNSIFDFLDDWVYALLSLRSFFLQPFRALLSRLSFSNLRQGVEASISSMDYNNYQSYKYDVFISFRGPDTRNTFVDHLYAHLTRKGIFAFKDDKRLEKGESLSPQLLQAIKNSRVSIIVFSERYAESTWCLEEMATIAQCRKDLKQTVFPVFYDIDPSHVRKQTGVYQNAFLLHMNKFKHDHNKVLRWSRAMVDLTEVVGWDVRYKPEFREIKNIVQEVIKLLGHKFSGFAEDFIGIQPRVEELESLLKLNSKDDEFRAIGIWGMAGIGKTTLASVLYDRVSYQFNASCFIENVSKIYNDGGATAVKKQILRQTIDEKNLETYSPSEISGIVHKRLRNRKFLVVLDNVDLLEQVEELAINPELLGKGSRMIITTRDMHILRVFGAQLSISHDKCLSYDVYEVPLLNNNDARALFYRKAFKGEDPSSRCVKLTPEVLKYAQGLPLAVRVVGSFLCTRNANQWRDALYRLRNNPDNKVMDVLQVSFEGLHSEEKEIFLHIACFFKGEKEDYVKRILDACGLHPHIGIPSLIERSLITIINQEILMHEMLQELGKKIVRQQFPFQPGSWSRLWLYEDFYSVMITETGTNNVSAIVLDQNVHISEHPRLRAEVLSIMRGLKILILYHTNFSGSLNFLSNSLQYLLWYGYPFASLPLNFEPYCLVELNMPCSSIQRLWDGHKDLPCLKRVDLSNSKYLVETPNFAGSRRLERLDFTGCVNLSRLQSLPELGFCATSTSGGRYFKMVSGSHDHRSGFYIFNCPLLEIAEGHNLALSWLRKLLKSPCHFRCGLDIVVPGNTIPQWFPHQFTANSRIRITDCVNEFGNWLGFSFCVTFVEFHSTTYGSHYPFSSQLPYPLYLSFESEQMEETFEIPIRLDLNVVDGSNAEHLWLIYISRPHCHFVTTGAQITFKAHPGLVITRWGLRMVMEHDIDDNIPFDSWTKGVHKQDYLGLDHVHESSSSSSSSSRPEIQLPYNWYEAEEKIKPKVQLRYNWHVTEEEENENREVNVKQSHLSDMGLTTADDYHDLPQKSLQ
ncbi:disease resistance protein RPV1 [Trifolium repens]|nr:disease resistance protein RPV1 [Trifolium repens]